VDTTKTRTPKTLSDVDEAFTLAADADTLYVASSSPRKIYAVPKQGGPARELVTAAAPLFGRWCHSLATDGAFVFYVDSIAASADHGLFKVPKAGGAPVLVVGGVADPTQCLAHDEGYVYFSAASSIFRVPSAGGAAEAIADATAKATTLAGGRVCFVKDKQAVAVVPITAGTPRVLGGDLGNTDTVAANAEACFAGNNKVIRFAADGSGRQVLAEDVGVRGLVADAGGVYWASQRAGANAVMMAKNGDPAAVVLTEAAGAQGVAADATHVFFTTSAEAAVRSVEK
jgi:hypothetical protein